MPQGRCSSTLPPILPFHGRHVNDAVAGADHDFAVLDVDLEGHGAGCEFGEFCGVVFGEIRDLEIVETGGGGLDLVPPHLGGSAAVGVDDHLAGFAAGLADELFAGEAEGNPDVEFAAEAFLPDVGLVIG